MNNLEDLNYYIRIIYSLLQNNENYIDFIKEFIKPEYSSVITNLSSDIFNISREYINKNVTGTLRLRLRLFEFLIIINKFE